MKFFAPAIVAFVMAIFVSPAANASILFNSVPGPYVAFGGITDGSLSPGGAFGEDYILDPSFTDPVGFLNSFQFVGGVSQSVDSGDTTFTGGTLDFTFFDTGGTAVNGFSVTLPGNGNFIWTINIGPGFVIPSAGSVDISIDGSDPGNLSSDGFNHTAQWFITGTAPAPGTSAGDNTFGNGDHSFSLDVSAIPEPASACLIGLGMLAGCFVRRRNS